MSRTNKYETNVKPHLAKIAQWYQHSTETQIARMLEVSLRSWENYKVKYPELREVLRKGKDEIIVELKDTMKKKAFGFTYTETKRTFIEVDGKPTGAIKVEEFTRYAQPDLGAMHLLLKNLDPTWRNDDMTTVELKREKLKLEQEKAEDNKWV